MMEIMLAIIARVAIGMLIGGILVFAGVVALWVFELISLLPKPTFPTLMLLAGVTIMLIVGYQLATLAAEPDSASIDDEYTGEVIVIDPPCFEANGKEYCTGLTP